MHTADALRALDRHQQRILAGITAAVALLDLPAAEARPPLARARWEMLRMLGEYRLFKHTEVFDPAEASGSPAQVMAARKLKAECDAAAAGFRAYVVHWSARDIAAEWAGYRPAMLAMAARLRAHLAHERGAITAVLAGSTRTRRLAG